MVDVTIFLPSCHLISKMTDFVSPNIVIPCPVFLFFPATGGKMQNPDFRFCSFFIFPLFTT
ncbi:hypothetical protein SAMN05444714_3237 [Yoonia litorea]|uniref:Uncharacterized protein n=1 Tax=Yoonia litorea TaxID=1123755 RepID=A0A1I6N2V6_9RHOB|nr:hypothetical protein SAMN05444714_3237 [Yoonia litorea]